MKRAGTSDIDTRGFRWPFGALERRRALALDEAAVRFAQAQSAQCALQAELAGAHAAYAEQVAAMAQVAAAVVDPGVRRSALSYLAAAAAGMQAMQQGLDRAVARCDEARLRLQHADRELQAVAKLREAALSDFTVQQRRVQAKEADLAGLARRFASRAAP